MEQTTTTSSTPHACLGQITAKLYRSRDDRMLGGVCGGLAKSFGVDATILRIALVAAIVFGFGLGAVAYAAAWVLMPEEPLVEGEHTGTNEGW